MALSDWYYKVRKTWTVGPITLNGSRISGISSGSMDCKFYDSSGNLVKTVSGVYSEISSQDYFEFVLADDDQSDFTEGDTYTYEHILTVSGQDYMITEWKDIITVLERYSDS